MAPVRARFDSRDRPRPDRRRRGFLLLPSSAMSALTNENARLPAFCAALASLKHVRSRGLHIILINNIISRLYHGSR